MSARQRGRLQGILCCYSMPAAKYSECQYRVQFTVGGARKSNTYITRHRFRAVVYAKVQSKCRLKLSSCRRPGSNSDRHRGADKKARKFWTHFGGVGDLGLNAHAQEKTAADPDNTPDGSADERRNRRDCAHPHLASLRTRDSLVQHSTCHGWWMADGWRGFMPGRRELGPGPRVLSVVPPCQGPATL